MHKNNLNLLIVLLLISLAAAKRCGKSYGKCPEGYCCSKFGFCGKIDTYCGKGCQPEFGECNGVKKTVTVKKVSTKVKSAKETNEQNIAESVVDVVDALINEEADDDSKNKVVEEIIDALAAEIDTANDSDPEEDDGNAEAEVVQNNDKNNEVEEASENISDEEGEGEEVNKNNDGNDVEEASDNVSDEEVVEEGGEEANKNNDGNEVSEDEITEIITLTDVITDTITEEETIVITDTIDNDQNTDIVSEKPTPTPKKDEEESGGTSEEPTPKKDGDEEESGGTSENPTPKKDGDEEESGGTSENPTPKKDGDEEESGGTSENPTPKKDGDEEESGGTSEEPTPKKDGDEEESGGTSEEPTPKKDGDEEESGGTSEEPTPKKDGDEEESGGTSEEPTPKKDGDEEESGGTSEEPTPKKDGDEEESSSSSSSTTSTTEKPAPTTTATTTTTTTTAPASSSGECSTEAFGMAQPFNGFFFGDFTGTSSDVQGRLAAKGTVNISGGYQNGGFIYDPVKHNEQTNLDCTDEKMKGDIKYAIVAGTLNFRDGGEIINGGVAYQNSVDIPGYIKEAIERHKCTVEKKNVIDFDKEKQNLTSLSKKLGNMKANTKTTNEWGKLVIDLVPGQKTYVIMEDISKYWGISINENGVNTDEITIIFNLLSDNITLSNFDISSINKYATRIVWNAPNAKKVRIENFRIQGSLLAPNADIEGYNGNIQGQMIGNSFKGNLQIDWVPFYGCLLKKKKIKNKKIKKNNNNKNKLINYI
jgi:choice-of-anchor A domain-containing protein